MPQNQPSNNPTGGAYDKINVIRDAYSQLRISGLTVNPTPEDLEVALDRLECFAAEIFERNICVGWNFEDTPDPNSPAGIKRAFKQMFATNLAVRLIPDFNKTVPDQLMRQASQSLSNASAVSARNTINQVPYPTRQPRGSGSTLRYNRWQRFYRGQGYAPNDCKTIRMYIGDINDYTEHFDAYLNDGETISNLDYQADTPINVISAVIAGPDINYQVEANYTSSDTVTQNAQLTLVITTSAGRKTTRIIYFEMSPRPKGFQSP